MAEEIVEAAVTTKSIPATLRIRRGSKEDGYRGREVNRERERERGTEDRGPFVFI